VRRGGCVALALFGGTLACAEWAGPSLGRSGLAIVPVVSVPVLGGGTVLVDDLDSLRVVVHLAVQGRTTGVVIDTSVGVDEAGNAALTVPVLVVGSAQTFAVVLQGIRSRDGAVLYMGNDTVTVRPGLPTRVDSVPVAYIGPCGLGAGCRVTVAPQDTTLPPGGSFVMRISIDSAGTAIAGVPAVLTNLTPDLTLVGADRGITALASPTGGAARVATAIRGAADTLRLTVSPLTAPAMVLISPGYATLTTLAPRNAVQLAATVTDIAGKPLSSSLATWTSRAPTVAAVSGTGLVTAGTPGSAIVVASAGPGIADSLAIMVGDNTVPPGNPFALALSGGRSFTSAKVGQPIAIDVVIDLSAVPATELLGSYDARFTWNTAVLRYDSTQAGGFGIPAIIPDTAAAGVLRFSATDAVGRGGSLTLVHLWFTAVGPGISNHLVALTTLATSVNLLDMLPGLLVAPGNVTVGP
jgi:hypothetical protein